MKNTNNNTVPVIVAVTPGEPAGIGPDLCIYLAQTYFPSLYSQNIWPTIIADPQLLQQRAATLQQTIHLHTSIESLQQHANKSGHILIKSVRLEQPCTVGKLNPANALYVLNCLDVAIHGCLTKEFSALITGPVHKGNIIQSGTPFTGHTEYLQKTTNADKVIMTFYCPQMLLALATTHLPLSQVSRNITYVGLKETLTLLHANIRQLFNLQQPRILVCGLNPHAGEQGHLGTEEQQIIIPVIQELNRDGLNIIGPLPADTIFIKSNLAKADAILAMYHDQGLPVLKHMAFSQAVNLTLGLPFIRTSVDHGTALDLAGSGKIFTENMQAAMDLSLQLIFGEY